VNIRKRVPAALVGNGRVADELVEIGPVVQLQRELISKGVAVENGMHALLVQSVHIDVGGD
jgi:hypothetical protein